MSAQKSKIAIGIVAPACPVSPELTTALAALARKRFGEHSHSLRFHPQCYLHAGHFAGTDEERGEAFLAYANDPEIDAIWFARGGYGSFRLLERIVPALSEAARQKTYLGYSDLGSLLAGLYGAGCDKVAHGPMPTDLNRDGGETTVARALSFLIEGNRDGIEPSAQEGRPLAAFNITILAHLMGTPWQPDLTGHVVMLEDIDEPLYRIDRSMASIMSAPKMRAIAGLKLGRLSKIVPNEPDFAQTAEDIVRFWCRRADVPYLGAADIGHDIDNKIVPFGLWRSL